jgi:hypothetical protein
MLLNKKSIGFMVCVGIVFLSLTATHAQGKANVLY